MGDGVESRFERYADVMVQALGHADRARPARWYLRGLMLPGQRKSVEPMAARVHPQDVRSAHQSMHHLVADSEWSDTALLAAVAREVVPVLSEAGQAPCFWIVDDTGFRKYGKHSVGVARQYCGPSHDIFRNVRVAGNHTCGQLDINNTVQLVGLSQYGR